jgi:hypothetical protein
VRFKFKARLPRERAPYLIRGFKRRNRVMYGIRFWRVVSRRLHGERAKRETAAAAAAAAAAGDPVPTNGFAQSLAFSSSFSANSYPTRNLQLRMLRRIRRREYYIHTRIQVTVSLSRLNRTLRCDANLHSPIDGDKVKLAGESSRISKGCPLRYGSSFLLGSPQFSPSPKLNTITKRKRKIFSPRVFEGVLHSGPRSQRSAISVKRRLESSRLV